MKFLTKYGENAKKHIWAFGADEYGQYISTGFHVMNCDCFFVTEIPYNAEITIFFEDEDNDKYL